MKPPQDCPHSILGNYWCLICSLYCSIRLLIYGFIKYVFVLRQWVYTVLIPLLACLLALLLTVEGEPLVYVGTYMDIIIYLSASEINEIKFDSFLSTLGKVDFMVQVTHFIGIECTWKHNIDGNLSISLIQKSAAETFVESLGLTSLSVSTFTTPYQSGLVIETHQKYIFFL